MAPKWITNGTDPRPAQSIARFPTGTILEVVDDAPAASMRKAELLARVIMGVIAFIVNIVIIVMRRHLRNLTKFTHYLFTKFTIFFTTLTISSRYLYFGTKSTVCMFKLSSV